MGEDRTDVHSGGRGGDRLTIAEAAALLGIHKNTVRNRIKNGPYRAELVQTERGPTYLIERDSLLTSLTTNTISSTSQELVSQQAMEFVQELLRPFVSELGEVKEELGAERIRRETAEKQAASLEAELKTLREPEDLTTDQKESLRSLRERLASGSLYPATGDSRETDSEYSEAMQRRRFLLLIFLCLTVVGAGISIPLATGFSCAPWGVLALGLLILPPLYGYWLGRQYILPLLAKVESSPRRLAYSAREGADTLPTLARAFAVYRAATGALENWSWSGSRYSYLAIQALEVALLSTVLSHLLILYMASSGQTRICGGYSEVLLTQFGLTLPSMGMSVGLFLIVVFSGLIGFSRARQHLVKQLQAEYGTEFGTEAVRKAVAPAGRGGRDPDALLGFAGTTLTTLSALVGLIKVFTDSGP